MKRYIRSNSNNYDKVANDYIKQIKEVLSGYMYVEPGFMSDDTIIHVTDITETSYETKISDRPPYTRSLIIRGFAMLDDSITNHPGRRTSGNVYDRYYERMFRNIANDIGELIENAIQNSICSCVVYDGAIQFEVIAEI